VRHFADAADVAYSINLMTWRNAMLGGAFVSHALGNSADALETIDQLGRYDLEAQGFEADDTAAARARLMLSLGDHEAAERWADQYDAPPASETLLPLMGRAQLTKAFILTTRNAGTDIQTAMQILDEFGVMAERAHSVRTTIEVLALRALARLSLGDSAGARETLIRAVELARRGLFVRTFVDLGPQMQKLLQQIAGHGPTAKSVGRILAAFEGGAVESRATGGNGTRPTADHLRSGSNGLQESLTPREREILFLMAEPIGLKVIAARMNISYATARRYTISIYSKFDVHTRWEAVDSAVRMGILPGR
jgi:ATP/maltotriose-dependent transcriptional regulator MalT